VFLMKAFSFRSHTMTEARRILLIQGHPDSVSHHLNRTLLQAYAEGAEAAGHTVRHIERWARSISRCCAVPMLGTRKRCRPR
jgi:multimeric flavodoxin WrbA